MFDTRPAPTTTQVAPTPARFTLLGVLLGVLPTTRRTTAVLGTVRKTREAVRGRAFGEAGKSVRRGAVRVSRYAVCRCAVGQTRETVRGRAVGETHPLLPGRTTTEPRRTLLPRPTTAESRPALTR